MVYVIFETNVFYWFARNGRIYILSAKLKVYRTCLIGTVLVLLIASQLIYSTEKKKKNF